MPKEFFCKFASLLLLSMIALTPFNAFAHKVNLFAFAEGDTIFVEGYFVDGKKAKNSEVVVLDSTGKEIQRGLTDDEGAFTFANPGVGALNISVNAGMGHRAEYFLSEDEFTDTEERTETPTTTPATKPAASQVTSAIDQQRLSKEVELAVARAIKPLAKNIAEMREEKSLAEVIGGIGFIFGAMGIFMYMKARKEGEKSQ